MIQGRAIAIGVLVALVVGVVAETARVAVAGATHEDPRVVLVPVGHVGDRLTYATFARDAPASGWKRLQDDAYQVSALTVQADRFGTLRDVILLSRGSSGTSQSGLPGEASHAFSGVVSQAVSLDDRSVVATLSDYTLDSTSFFAVQQNDQGEDVEFGPDHPSDLFGPDASVKQPLLTVQGHAYALGESLPEAAAQLLLAEVQALHSGYGITDLQAVNVTTTVSQAGMISDRLVLDLEVSGCGDLVVTDADLATAVGLRDVEFLGMTTVVPARVCFRVDQWLAADSPYPVLVHSWLTTNGDDPREHLASLAAFQAGTDVIPWDRQGKAVPSTGPLLERSAPGQSWPDDGTQAPFGFAMEAALAAVQGDATLLQFQLWRMQHPQGQLAGANLEPLGNGEGQGAMWSLTFAEPDGAAFVVQSQQARTSGPTTQNEAGSFTLDPFDPAPTAPITWTAIERLHEAAFPTGAVPNRAGWGFLYHGTILECPNTDQCTPWSAGFYDGTTPTQAIIGSSANYTKNVANVGAERLADHLLVLDASTGELLTQRTSKRDTRIDPLATEANYAAPQPAFLPPGAHVSGSVPRAAVTAASAFVVFLVLYFLPILKWLGGSSAGLIPGFSRLREAELLDNPVRDAMVKAIHADPGITPPELQRLTKAGWSTVVYHLGVLEKKRLVSSVVDGRHKRFFPHEMLDEGARDRIAALRHPRTSQLYRSILQSPGIRASDLGRRLGVSRSTINWHIQRLEAVGLVGRDTHWLKAAFFANPDPGAPANASEVV